MGGKLRIIGGQWRRSLLPVVDLPGLRPTTDRVRETLFNWLQSDIAGARCLDLFAGTGALGFEAASRGAASVTMLELQKAAWQTLAQNIKSLNAQNIQLLKIDALSWLSATPDHVFDVVFLDPPFDSLYLGQACEMLENQSYLSEHACIYLELNSKQALPTLPENWCVTKEKKAGQVRYCLVRRNWAENSI